MEHPGKCRHLHGHSVRVAISLSAERLNEQGMVCDFAEIGAIAARVIETELDHNLLLHRDDPLIPFLRQANERFLALDEHPTAEYLSRWIFRYIADQGYPVESVSLWETASACASYRE
jgi:6-pyruvoyltetrahydropterin/6-carboxytetrahydropterin synthase